MSPTSGGGRFVAAAKRVGFNWERMKRLADDWLPTATDPSPLAKSAICRQTPEVGAVCRKVHVRICAGGAQ